MPPGLQAPPVQTFAQADAGLGAIYDPQTSSVNSQIAALAPQQAAQMSSLDQAKVNAFKTIDNTANSRGMLFSGFTPDQQAQYTGTKYLPAVANLQTSFNNTKTGLTDTLNKINAARYTQAQDIVTKGQQAANDAAYKNAQLSIAQQNADTSTYKASASAARGPSGSRGGGNSGGGNTTVNPPQEFLGHIAAQFKAAGSNPSRQQQDAWANAWFAQNKVPVASRNAYWNLFNTTYKRPSDPSKDWLYSKSAGL